MTTLCPHCRTSQNVVDGKIEEHFKPGYPRGPRCEGSGSNQPVQPAETETPLQAAWRVAIEISAILERQRPVSLCGELPRDVQAILTAIERQLTSALAREKELREKNDRLANLAHRIYDQLGDDDVWGRSTAGGSAELDYIQDELERCKPAITKPTP